MTLIKENRVQILYFIIAILGIGGMGVWLPYLVDPKTDTKDFCQNGTTYFIAIIVSGCISLIAKVSLLNTLDPASKIFKILWYLFILLGSIFILVLNEIFMADKQKEEWAVLITIGGLLISYILWWAINNSKSNDNFAALGGTI